MSRLAHTISSSALCGSDLGLRQELPILEQRKSLIELMKHGSQIISYVFFFIFPKLAIFLSHNRTWINTAKFSNSEKNYRIRVSFGIMGRLAYLVIRLGHILPKYYLKCFPKWPHLAGHGKLLIVPYPLMRP